MFTSRVAGATIALLVPEMSLPISNEYNQIYFFGEINSSHDRMSEHRLAVGFSYGYV